jgi:hypothetical protein
MKFVILSRPLWRCYFCDLGVFLCQTVPDNHLVAWVADFGENVRPVIFMGACDAA